VGLREKDTCRDAEPAWVPAAHVAPNDFLFSVIAEETGFIGGLCVVGLYAILFLRGLRIAGEARDRLGSLLATGVVVMLFFSCFINIGMTIGLMPIKDCLCRC